MDIDLPYIRLGSDESIGLENMDIMEPISISGVGEQKCTKCQNSSKWINNKSGKSGKQKVCKYENNGYNMCSIRSNRNACKQGYLELFFQSSNIPSLRTMCVVLVLMCLQTTQGFNLDVPKNVEFKAPGQGTPGSYFGYALAMDSSQKWLLSGAPRSDNKYLPNAKSPGTVYICVIVTTNGKEVSSCDELKIVEEKTGVDTERFNGTTKTFKNGQDNQWLGASLDVTNNIYKKIVACASRWYNTYFLDEGYYFMNGICYELPLDLTFSNVRQIPALIDSTKQTMMIGNYTKYNYGMGSLGSSVHYSNQGNDLLIGSPGLRTWTGGFIDKTGDTAKMTQYREPATEMSEMAGYAVTSGKFFNGDTYFAVGAPRDKLTGKVYIYKADSEIFVFEDAAVTLDGSERNGLDTIPVNGYFGACVCAVDVNNDGRDDLIVGVPFYSRVSSGMSSSKMEEGLALVYLGQADMRFDLMHDSLQGNGATRGRFGTAITSLGDLNKDGYNDIAIGAPYEDELQGAIYIYNGCSTGIWPQYSQRIAAADVSQGLMSFGSSFSKHQDMNEDGVNDIAVGAYLSDRAYLLYGQSVINVDLTLETSVEMIDKDSRKPEDRCQLGNSTVSCLEVKVCFSYSNRILSPIDVKATITLDTYLGTYNRIAWLDNKAATFTIDQIRIFSSSKKCSGAKVYVKSMADLVTPVKIRAEYEAKDLSSLSTIQPAINKFNGADPEGEVIIATKMLEFKKDCPNNDCKTNLQLSAFPSHGSSNGYYIIGTTPLNIDIQISKTGDPSYSSTLFVAFPKSLHYQKLEQIFGDPEVTCSFVEEDKLEDSADAKQTDSLAYLQRQNIPEKSDDEFMMICSFGNPLFNDTGVRFQLVMRVPEDLTESELLFRLNATTLSTETYPENNTQSFTVKVRNQVSTSFNGVSRPSIFTINDVAETYIASHVYELRNGGPSPLPSAKLSIQFPQVQQDSRPLLYLNQTTWSCRAPCMITCSFSEGTDTYPIVHSSEQGPTYHVNESPSTGEARELADMENVDCVVGKCSRYECHLQNIPPRESAVVSLQYVVNGKILDIITDGQGMNPRSEAYVRFEETARLISKVDEHFTDVRTSILPMSPPPQQVAWWIYLVSILGAILLLVIIVVILWRCGFFRRKKREEMDKMQHTGEIKKMLPDDEAKA